MICIAKVLGSFIGPGTDYFCGVFPMLLHSIQANAAVVL
jgi:hypothetical protein